MTFNAMPVTIIGVLPATYRHLEINPERAADIFTPFRWDTAQPNRGGHFIRGVGRLKDGDTHRAEGAPSSSRSRHGSNGSIPPTTPIRACASITLLDSMVGESRPVVLLLAGAVIVVLLVACANVANLLLARGTGRLRELALRAAIGADRGRLIRQMLDRERGAEPARRRRGHRAGALATRALTVLAAAGIPRADQIAMDGVVLAFALDRGVDDQRHLRAGAGDSPVAPGRERRA